ncbi:hypothetical protein T484DRAFT_3641635, partial [Baffinella frigidus]
TPGSLSGLRTEHPWEPTPGSLSGQHTGYTYELAPCYYPRDHLWRATLETTMCLGAASIEFWPQRATTVYPLPTLEPREIPAPQGELTIAAQAELDLMTAAFPELVSQYFSAEPQKGIFWGGTFPLEEVDYEHFGLDTALTAAATEPTIPMVKSLFLRDTARRRQLSSGQLSEADPSPSPQRLVTNGSPSPGAPSAAPGTTPVPSIFFGTDVSLQGGVTAAALGAELAAPLALGLFSEAVLSPCPKRCVTDGFPSPGAPWAAPGTTPVPSIFFGADVSLQGRATRYADTFNFRRCRRPSPGHGQGRAEGVRAIFGRSRMRVRTFFRAQRINIGQGRSEKKQRQHPFRTIGRLHDRESYGPSILGRSGLRPSHGTAVWIPIPRDYWVRAAHCEPSGPGRVPPTRLVRRPGNGPADRPPGSSMRNLSASRGRPPAANLALHPDKENHNALDDVQTHVL